MPQPGRTWDSAEYRYGYNGMETDPEVKEGAGQHYTTYFRQYDPRLGRWWSHDPITQMGESPYAAMFNNPITFADPFGNDPPGGGGSGTDLTGGNTWLEQTTGVPGTGGSTEQKEQRPNLSNGQGPRRDVDLMKPFRDAQNAARNAITAINTANAVQGAVGAVNALVNPAPQAPRIQTMMPAPAGAFAPNWAEEVDLFFDTYVLPTGDFQSVMGMRLVYGLWEGGNGLAALGTWAWNVPKSIFDPPETWEESLTDPANVGYDLRGHELSGSALIDAKQKAAPWLLAPAARGAASVVGLLTEWSPIAPVVLESAAGIMADEGRLGLLTYDATTKSWNSSGGLLYTQGSKHGNRIKHIPDHTVLNPNKPVHTVFSVSRQEVLGLLDEAWLMRGTPSIHAQSGNWNYTVDLGRVIGIGGETRITIGAFPNSNKIITSFPIK